MYYSKSSCVKYLTIILLIRVKTRHLMPLIIKKMPKAKKNKSLNKIILVEIIRQVKLMGKFWTHI